MNDNPTVGIEINGHTDYIGTNQYNQVLCENRAKSVYAFLMENNISPSWITYKEYGESILVDTNDTEKGRQMNRMVEFMIFKKIKLIWN